jgi:hypothetical protein
MVDFTGLRKVDLGGVLSQEMVRDLLNYCKLDTYAMVELIGVLKSNIN